METKIKILVRHCFHSKISEQPNKKKSEWFSKEKALQNLKNTIDNNICDITIIYDKHFGDRKDTFLKDEKNVIEIDCGNEAKSFLFTLDYASSLKENDETIIYFLEDDYVHKQNWNQVLIEGLSLPIDYVTLYDHNDKYIFDQYKLSQYQIITTKSTHWRTIPSTTNTYAMKLKTLKRDLETHKYFSYNREISADHEKFLKLWSEGKSLISCIPGFSTHCEKGFESPIINWKEVLESTTI